MKYKESAFPVVDSNGEGTTGMDLRDYIAGQALPETIKIAWEWHEDGGIEYEDVHADAADMAYKFADAMMARREEKKKEPVPEDYLDNFLDTDERMKNIVKRILENYPLLTKKDILLDFTVYQLLEMLGDEQKEVKTDE